MRARNYYRKRVSPWPRRLLMAALVLVLIYAASQLISYAVQMQQEKALREELSSLIAEGEQEWADGSGTPDDVTEAVAEHDASQNAAEGELPEATAAPAYRQAISISQAASVDPRKKPEILMTYQALWERNNDLVGWLNIKALPKVDLPVVQRDHTYYLRRDFDGRSNMNGTAFLDTICSIWPRSDNLIIYAHNMKSGEMFGGLHKLMQEPFYRANPITTFNSIYERASYVPIAVVLCSLQQGEDFFNFYVANFKTQSAFDSYISRARELSSILPPYDAVYGDQLLTLVTCYDEAHTQRLLVILRRVRENENLEELAEMWV